MDFHEAQITAARRVQDALRRAKEKTMSTKKQAKAKRTTKKTTARKTAGRTAKKAETTYTVPRTAKQLASAIQTRMKRSPNFWREVSEAMGNGGTGRVAQVMPRENGAEATH